MRLRSWHILALATVGNWQSGLILAHARNQMRFQAWHIELFKSWTTIENHQSKVCLAHVRR